MRHRLGAALVYLTLAAVLGGCQVLRPSGAGRPTASQIAALLPGGARVDEVVYADLTGDGRDEALVAATVPSHGASPAAALIFAPGRGGRYGQVFQRYLPGVRWLPIQTGSPADGAPLAAVFASQTDAGHLSYVVVQQRDRGLQVTLAGDGIVQGGIRFVPEGLLESRGDTDRLYRWGAAGWEAEDLGSQYLPPTPPATVVISYVVDPVRGPRVEGARAIRARVGGYLFLRRMDRGEPSRVQLSGGAASFTRGLDGLVALHQPDQIEIHIEGPAYSGRTLTLSVRVDP